MGTKGKNRVQDIYANAGTNIDEPKNLAKIITAINSLDWYSAREEGLGDLYEGLLQKNADEKKSGAGQYFTPRPLINAMVQLMQPQLDERCGDPACAVKQGCFKRWLLASFASYTQEPGGNPNRHTPRAISLHIKPDGSL